MKTLGNFVRGVVAIGTLGMSEVAIAVGEEMSEEDEKKRKRNKEQRD